MRVCACDLANYLPLFVRQWLVIVFAQLLHSQYGSLPESPMLTGPVTAVPVSLVVCVILLEHVCALCMYVCALRKCGAFTIIGICIFRQLYKHCEFVSMLIYHQLLKTGNHVFIVGTETPASMTAMLLFDASVY